MYLVKRSNGYFYVYYEQPSGKMTSITTHSKRKYEAKKFMEDFRIKLRYDNPLNVTKRNLVRFRLEYLLYSSRFHSPNHTNSMKITFNMLIKSVGDIQLTEVTRTVIQNWIEERMLSVGPHAIKRDLANLSSAFKWAINKNYAKENPTIGIKKPRIPEKMPVFFTKEQFDTLLSVVEDDDLHQLFQFAVLTGLRQGDLIRLRWAQLNLNDGSLLLDNRFSLTKSRRVHNLPLSKKSMGDS